MKRWRALCASRRDAFAALSLSVSCSAACAHGAFGSSDSLWSGVFHLLTAPLAIAALIGAAIAGAGVRDPWTPAAGGVAGLAAVLSATWPQHLPLWFVPAAVIFVGVAAIVAWRAAPAFVVLLAACAGLAAGRAADLDQIATGSVLGVAGASALFLVLALVIMEDLPKIEWIRPHIQVGRRIAGSWVAAIGLLLLALTLRGL